MKKYLTKKLLVSLISNIVIGGFTLYLKTTSLDISLIVLIEIFLNLGQILLIEKMKK